MKLDNNNMAVVVAVVAMLGLTGGVVGIYADSRSADAEHDTKIGEHERRLSEADVERKEMHKILMEIRETVTRIDERTRAAFRRAR